MGRLKFGCLFGTLFRTIIVRGAHKRECRLDLHVCVRVRHVRCVYDATTGCACIGVDEPSQSRRLAYMYVCVFFFKFSSNPKCVQLAKSCLLCKIAELFTKGENKNCSSSILSCNAKETLSTRDVAVCLLMLFANFVH